MNSPDRSIGDDLRQPANVAERRPTGAGVLAALITDSMAGLRSKIGLYREALEANGHDPARGHVTLMLHTFVGDKTHVSHINPVLI
jgi:hypothetical protein